MKDLYSKLKRNVSELSGTISGNKYLLGVSGGVDSVVLFKMFLRLKKEFLFEFEVASVDHALREQSAEEIDYIQKICEMSSIPFHSTVWTAEQQEITGTNENAARIFRYDFFEKKMREKNIHNLVLAHHADDQAETVLMKLIRGGNIREVQAIEPKRNFKEFSIIRPMLSFSKADIINFANENNIKYFDDETNITDFTLRNRLRNHIVPIMKEENPRVLEHFGEFTEQLQTTNRILEKYFNPIFLNDFATDMMSGTLKSLEKMSVSENVLFWNVFKKKKQLFKLNDKQVRQISMAVKSKKPNLEIYLDDGLEFIKDHNQFTIEKIKANIPLNKQLSMNEKASFADGKYTIVINDSIKNSNSIKLVSDEIPEKIILRNRIPGDTLELSNGHHQKLKKRMIDLKLSKKQKENALILTFDDKIVWVDGIYSISNYQKDKKYSFYLQIRGDVNETK